MQSFIDRDAHHAAVQRALALGRSSDPAALPELVKLLAMPSPEVRRLAASAIGKLAGFGADPGSAVKALVRPDFYLPEFDLYIEYWGMEDNLDYQIGMLKKKKLYQQAEKKLISLYGREKHRLREALRERLSPHVRLPSASESESAHTGREAS